MLIAVPLRVERRIIESKVGCKVDDVVDPAAEARHDRLAGTVGQAEEHQVGVEYRLVARGHVGQVAVHPGEGGVEIGDRLPAWVSPVAAMTSKSGCVAQIRNSSAPVNPDAPMMATLCIRTRYGRPYAYATICMNRATGTHRRTGAVQRAS